MVPFPRKLIFSLLLLFIGNLVKAQLLTAGGGFGTYNILADETRGVGPALKIEYVLPEERVVAYWDASLFSKSYDGGGVPIYNSDGIPIGFAQATNKTTFLYNQIGFKGLFGGNFSQHKLLPFLGGGAAIVLVTNRNSYKSSLDVKDDVTRQWNFGFHFTTGVQYNIKPVILELKGNFDLVIPQLGGSSVSNVLTNLRFCITVPVAGHLD